MKRTSNLFLTFASMAAAVASCHIPNEMDPIYYPDPVDLHITASINGLSTRTGLSGDNQLVWKSGDRLGIYVNAKDEPTSNLGTILKTDAGQYFFGTVNPFSAGDKLFAYYPYVISNVPAKLIPMSIAREQSQENGTYESYDGSVMPMVADVYTFKGDSDSKGIGNVNLTLNPLGAVARFVVYGTYTDEKIQSVTFTADRNIAGSFTYDITSDIKDIDAPAGVKEVMTRVTGNVPLVADKAQAANVYMTLIPGTVSGTVKVRTDFGAYNFDISQLVLERAKVTSFELELTGANREELIGTDSNPYRLRTVEDLQKMKEQVIPNAPDEVYFVLENDIDMKDIAWTPLDAEGKYPICFDGGNHKISNLAVSGDAASFFGHLWGTVKNLTFENATISAQGSRAGVVAATIGLSGRGNNHAGHLENVHASGSVNHSTDAALVGWTGQAGGLAGELAYSGSSIRRCSADVEVTSDFLCGGLVGQANAAAVIEECFATGNVKGGAVLPKTPEADRKDGLIDPTAWNTFNVKLAGAGGLVGSLSETVVKNCYATGNVTNTDADRGVAGGLVGVTIWSATVTDSYATGDIVATLNGGGILGASAFYVHSDNLVSGCIGYSNSIRNTGPDINSARVIGFYWLDKGGAVRNCYGKSAMTITMADGTEKDTSIEQDDMDSSTDKRQSVLNNGKDTDDIISAARTIGWDEEVWDLSGVLPKLKWEKK